MTALFVRSADSPAGNHWGTQYLVELGSDVYRVPRVKDGWAHRRPGRLVGSDYQVALNRNVRELLEWLGVPLDEEHARIS